MRVNEWNVFIIFEVVSIDRETIVALVYSKQLY